MSTNQIIRIRSGTPDSVSMASLFENSINKYSSDAPSLNNIIFLFEI